MTARATDGARCPDGGIRLNLGCGGSPLEGYVNVDMDSLEALRGRYPQQHFADGLIVHNYDIFNLPYTDGTVDEVRADSLIEHLPFPDEPRFFHEVKRVLRSGGLLRLATPDFEDAVRLWLAAKDDWKEFYRSDDKAIRQQHWFGQYSHSTDNRWGYLSAMIFGSQNGPGQFHTNCYTVPKIRAILRHLGLQEKEISRFRWKGDRDLMIQVVAQKI
jgi:predicted SAM-dependent methyltransferase